MTVNMCLSICRSKGFDFAGVEWQTECHCGNLPENGFEMGYSLRCNETCAGDSNQFCGGPNAMNVWRTPSMDLKGLCVYDFPSNRRVLDGYWVSGDKNLTIQACSEACSGREYNNIIVFSVRISHN